MASRAPLPLLDPAWRPPEAGAGRATVVCVHGAIVDGAEMVLLRHRLRRLGYRTKPFFYHSVLRGFEDNARRLAACIRATEGDTVHVVGHSMGGVLARWVFEHEPDPRPGRIVAIGSPLVDCWTGRRVTRLTGPFAAALIGRTVAHHLKYAHAPAWRGGRDLGILAGTLPFGVGRLWGRMPRPNDGIVCWQETRLEGARDHITFHLNHFGMLFSWNCFFQIARFLAAGKFLHAGWLQTSETGKPAA